MKVLRLTRCILISNFNFLGLSFVWFEKLKFLLQIQREWKMYRNSRKKIYKINSIWLLWIQFWTIKELKLSRAKRQRVETIRSQWSRRWSWDSATLLARAEDEAKRKEKTKKWKERRKIRWSESKNEKGKRFRAASAKTVKKKNWKKKSREVFRFLLLDFFMQLVRFFSFPFLLYSSLLLAKQLLARTLSSLTRSLFTQTPSWIVKLGQDAINRKSIRTQQWKISQFSFHTKSFLLCLWVKNILKNFTSQVRAMQSDLAFVSSQYRQLVTSHDIESKSAKASKSKLTLNLGICRKF